MTITKTVNGTEATLRVDGWLDTQASPELLSALDQLGEDIKSLILDFSGLEYISSSGIRAVVAAYKQMDGALVVKGASEGVMNAFHATGIDKRVAFEA